MEVSTRLLLVAGVLVIAGCLVAAPLLGLQPDTSATSADTPGLAAPNSSPSGHQTTPSGHQTTPSGHQTTTAKTNNSITVAFIADGGMTKDSRAVLNLINDEDADVLVHSGDFDYHQDPAGFSAMLNDTVGPDFPVIPAIGNHDIFEWDGYQQYLRQRTTRADGLSCSGDLGLESTCTYKSLTVVSMSEEVCSIPSGDDEEYPAACGNYASYEPEQYVNDQFDSADTPWQVCSWHYPHHDYQVGDKSAGTLALYDTCREAGAQFIATGHNHAYARTYPMASFENNRTAAESPPYTLGSGITMALVTGASGRSFYETTDAADSEWWANTHTSGEFGAFFCKLSPDGTGVCYFKTTDGNIIDGPFNVTTG